MDEIFNQNLPYQPISKKDDSDGWVGSELFYAQQEAKNKLPPGLINNWDEQIAKWLDIKKDELYNNFSAEQIDAIGIAIYQIKNNKAFILGDETGKGKGRILAGITKWAILNNLNVVFFTEKHALFTDFWRDLTFTENTDINYKVLHPEAKIYSVDGEEIYKSSAKNVKQILEEKEINKTLILTTYSQVSNSQQKKRLGWFEEVLEEGIIILDESHNASGESNTNKFISKLLKKTKGVIFSSATFMKEENEINLYQKAYSLDKSEWMLLNNLLNNAPNGLRRFLTYDLTRNLSLWRREHEPPMHEWETICSEIKNADIFSQVLQELAKMHEEIMLKHQEQMGNIWYEWGGEIQRLARNFILLSKIDTLVDQIIEKEKQNEKSVIIIDSTMASLIHKIGLWLKQKNDEIIIDEEEETEDESIIDLQNNWNFSLALKWVGEKLVGQYEKNEKWETWIEKIKIFDSLKLSPIDTIKEKLNKYNIKCSEISGRNFFINDNGIICKQKINRILETKNFNDGLTNVAILTRAGAAGISLHSDRNFKDNRVRNLFELEIVNRANTRIQFIGRVRRKNQVHEPKFYRISSQLAFEQRINDYESLKLQRAKAYIRASQEEEITLYNEKSNFLAFTWLKRNKSIAWRLGIYLNVNRNLYYIDSILKRSILLSQEEQENMLRFIIDGSLDYHEEHKIDYSIHKVENFWSHMTEEAKIRMQEEYKIKQDKRAFLGSLDYGWCAIAEIVGKTKLNKIDKDYLINILNNQKINTWENSLKFLLHYYQKRKEFNYYISPNTQRNLSLVKNIKPGSLLKIIWKTSVYYGYAEEIRIAEKNENSILHNWLKFRLINPTKIKNIYHVDEKIYLNYQQLMEEATIQIYPEKSIQWEQFERNNEEVELINYYWMGHPLYIYYLKQCYNLGEDNIFYDNKINHRMLSAIKLPDYFNFEYAKSCKKPIPPTEVVNYIIEKNPEEINNSINQQMEATIRLVQTTGGYQLMLKPEVSKNKKIFDFAIKKRLGMFKYINGFETYFINYKDIRIILLMLEKRGLGWFV